MANAIVFTSNTGFTKQYAALLGEKLGLPCYSLKEAVASLPKGSSVLYLGWICAQKIKGLKKAERRYRIEAIGAVGVSFADQNTVSSLKKANQIGLPLFYLQGGVAPEQLKGIYKWVLSMVAKAGAQAQKETDQAVFAAMKQGGDFSSEEALDELIHWYRAQN